MVDLRIDAPSALLYPVRTFKRISLVCLTDGLETYTFCNSVTHKS